MRVVGLDLSLTSTGASDGYSAHAFRTDPAWQTERRMSFISDECCNFVARSSQWIEGLMDGTRWADLVVIEGAAFGARGNAVDQLAGLRWVVRHRLWDQGVPFAIVTPTALKKYTTGNGNATKAEMVEAVRTRHGIDLMQYKVKDGRSDRADAYALAAMGYAFLGQPLKTTGTVPPCPELEVNYP